LTKPGSCNFVLLRTGCREAATAGPLDALERNFHEQPEPVIPIHAMRESMKVSIEEQRPEPLVDYDFNAWCQQPAPALQPLALEEVLIVTGLPRSGTSMLMRALAAGGIDLLVDDQRPPDESNRLGYFEFAPVKNLARDASWLEQSRGKAVKIVAPLLQYLPAKTRARVLVLHRPLAQVLASQEAMLSRLGTAALGAENTRLSRQFARLMESLPGNLARSDGFQVLHVSFEAMLADPVSQCARLAAFLGLRFNPVPAAAAIDPAQRRFY
jgi:hypothetical protein